MAHSHINQTSQMDDDKISVHSNISDDIEELPLTVLFKFIKPFNSDRTELNTFITNVNSAFSLAKPSQSASLFLYVVSQLSTTVVNEIQIHELSSCTELKTKLKL